MSGLTIKIIFTIVGAAIAFLTIEAPEVLDALKDLFLWDVDEL